MTIFEWANRHGVPQSALTELLTVIYPDHPTGDATPDESEAAVQSSLRLMAAKRGGALWRNNSGAFQDDNGAWVRYGVANTSKKINAVFKSSDLIGPTPKLVTKDMVGSVVAIFTAIEVKTPGWKHPRASNKREQAQSNFLQFVNGVGGIGMFAQSVEDVFK